MAREVVRSLTTQYREEGADTVVRKNGEVRRSLEEAAEGYRKMAAASEKTPAATKAVQRAHTELAQSLAGNSRAMQIYNRDVETLRKSVSAGLGLNTFRRDLQQIQQNLQNIGAPKANVFGDMMNFALVAKQSKKAAEDSASVFVANFEKIERKAAAVGQRINDTFDFGRTAKSAEESFSAFAPVFDRIDRKAAEVGKRIDATFQFQRSAKSAADSFRVLEGVLDEVIVKEKKASDAFAQSISKIERSIDPLSAAQDKLNQKLREYGELEAKATTQAERGIIARAKLAAQTEYRSSTQTDVGEYIDKKVSQNAAAAARETERYEESLRRIKQEIDPVTAAQDALNAKLLEYGRLRADGAITDQQLAQGQQLAQRQFEYTKRSAEGLFDSTKLGTQDLQNLQYQLNDIAVSLASGQSPFTVMMQQGAQIGQMFGPNSSVSGALKSVGAGLVSFLTNPINLAILAIATLAGSFAMIYSAFKSNVKPIGDQLEIQKKAADDLAGSYDNMAEAMKRAGQASVGVMTFKSNASAKDLAKSAQQSLKDAFDPTFFKDLGFSGGSIFTNNINEYGAKEFDVTKKFAAFREPLLKFFDEMVKGKGDAIALQDAISEIASGSEDKNVQKVALELLNLSDAGADAQRQIEALARSLDEMKSIQRETDFSDGIKGLEGLIPDRRPAIEQIKEYARQAREAASSESERMKVTIKQTAAEDALKRAEDARREGVALDLREITARSAQEKANIAAQRVRIQLSQETTDQDRIARESQDAYTVALKQAQFADSEALRQRKESRQETIDQMQIEANTLGMTEAAAAEATYRFNELAAAKKAANESGQLITQEEINAIELAAAQVGYLTDQIAAATKAADLAKNIKEAFKDLGFDRSLIGLSDEEKQVREFVHGIGAEYESANGQRLAAEFRYNKALQKTADQLQEIRSSGKEAFLDIVDAISSGENALDAFANALGSVGKMFAKIGAEKAYDWLTGKSSGKAAAYGGPVDVIEAVNNSAQALNKTLQKTASFDGSYGPQRPQFDGSYGPQNFSGSYGPQLPASVTGDGFSQSRASTVAGQSVPVQMWNFFAGKGLAPHQIAGILGNAKAESGFNPTAVGDNGQAFGLFQHNDRKASLFNSIGGKGNLGDVNGQLEFVWKEFQTSEKKAYQRLIAARDYVEANDAMISFERPSGYQNGVKNAHNYSGRLAYTKEALNTYGSGGASQQDIARQTSQSVSDGVVDANRRMVNGAVPGVDKIDPWTSGGIDLRKGERPAVNSVAQGTGLFSKDGLNIASAGIGSFFNGMQSGNPLSGGLSGLFSGIGASSSIASAFPSLAGIAGPLGAVGGAALGIIGGIIGARKQRKQQHQQKAEAWEQIRPQYEAFDRSLSGDKQGDLRAYITDGWGQLSQFMKVGGDAWKMGKGNSTAQFNSTGKKLFEGFIKMLDEFQQGFDFMIQDMSSGQGLEGSFAKGRAATKDLAAQIKKTRDDVDIAFGNVASIDFLNTPQAQQQAADTERSRADAISRYNQAAAKYSLSLLYTAEVVSDVAKTVDGLRGTAAGLNPIFKDLGYSAEDAAKVIDGRLNEALRAVAENFIDGFQRNVNDLSGKGYFNDFTDLFKDFDTAISDANILNVDPTVIQQWFKLASQDIVNGAELTGDAFNELIQRFPRLQGIISQFVDDVKQSAKELAQNALDTARANLDRSYQHEVETINNLIQARQEEASVLQESVDKFTNFRDQLKQFRDSLKLDNNLSNLNGKDRVDEARRQYDELLSKARAGDEDAMGRLTGVAQEYLTEAKDYYQTSTDYGDIFTYVSKSLADTQIINDNALSVAQSQLTKLENQIKIEQDQLATMKAQYEAVLGLNEGILSLAVAFKEYAAAAAAARQQGIPVPGTGGVTTPVERNGGWTADSASPYLSKNKDVAAAIAAGETFGLPKGYSAEVYASAHYGLFGQAEGRGWASGGYTGTGGMYEYAGPAHKNEVIWSQQNVADWGGPAVVDTMRTTGMIPSLAAFDMRNDGRRGRDDEDDRNDRRETNQILRVLVGTTGGGLQKLIEISADNAKAAEIVALAYGRDSSR